MSDLHRFLEEARQYANDPRLIADAVGWLWARTVDEVRTGDHTLFVAEVLRLERGTATSSLVYLNRSYTGLP